MKLLALDTSTDTLSLALQCGPSTVLQHTGSGGAQASATVLAQIMTLLRQAGCSLRSLDAIVIGAGPGAFTGLRTACAVAQGLALGADLPVLPLSTLLALAEEGRHQHQGPTPQDVAVYAVLDARMHEVYHAHYRFRAAGAQWQALSEASLCAPQTLRLPDDALIVGNAFAVYAADWPAGGQARLNALPTATALLRLAPAALAQGQALAPEQAQPLYVRDKVAQTTQERQALRDAPTPA
ncbi:MAG: tRNA (adenosine(37)-N6)-threonylcarbamoyltransferase complex dimerization subunit type 1 TsaB [Rhodoferax sp.]